MGSPWNELFSARGAVMKPQKFLQDEGSQMRLPHIASWCLASSLVMATGSIRADEFDDQIAAIKSVQKEAIGNDAASKAVRWLSSQPVTSLTKLLLAFEDASPLSANYLRAAIETIVDRQLQVGVKLPIKDLEAFTLDRQRDPRARRLAYENLRRVDDTAETRLIPGMLLDPSSEFRRDAVRLLMTKAAELPASQKDEAIAAYQQALQGATEEDQVKEISGALKKLGTTVDLQQHFGFLTKWKAIGPFDNKGLIGFDAVYAPEQAIDLAAKLPGQTGEVAWGEITTKDDFGVIDIAKSISPHKGAVMYLTTDFASDRERSVELRLGTPNAWKVWINGQLLFGRDEYHRGMAIDQYRVKATLKAGSNRVLVKLCQNEQTEDWAQRYQLQLRVCDASGVAIHETKQTAKKDN